MSLQIQLKKSAVSQKQPFASDLAVGELALNYNADGPFLTCKDTAGNVRKLNNVWVAATAPTSPSAGDLWLDTSSATPVLKAYKDSTTTWVGATSVPLATTTVFGTVRLASAADVTNGTSGKVVDAAQLQSKVAAEISSALNASPTTIQDLTVSNNATITGNLTVNGTTTTLDTTNLLVEDKNIEMGVVATPTNTTADGGGITLRGATNKTINWVNATGAWTSSERFSYPLGTAAAPTITFTGDPNTGIYSPGADQLALSTNGTGRLFVDSSGRVGVGTAAPAVPLSVATAASGEALRLTNGTNNERLHFYTGANALVEANNSNLALTARDANSVILSTTNTERLRITSAGLVGIGTSSPSELLSIQSASNTAVKTIRTGSGEATLRRTDTAAVIESASGSVSKREILFQTSDGTTPTERLRITSAGNVGIGTSAPVWPLDVRGSGNFFIENGFLGLDAQSSPRLGFVKKAGGAPFLAVGSATSFQISHSSGTELNPVSTNTYTPRLTIDTSGRVGIGTTSPTKALDVTGSTPVLLLSNTEADSTIKYTGIASRQFASSAEPEGYSLIGAEALSNNNNVIIGGGFSETNAATVIRFNVASTVSTRTGTEAARIDSSGRLLVGTSTSVNDTFGASLLQVSRTDGNIGSLGKYGDDSFAPLLYFRKSRGALNTQGSVLSGDSIGSLIFTASDGTGFISSAQIAAQVDGTPGTNDMPGRLVFSTTADGASSPTERMRINSAGFISLGGDTNTGFSNPSADNLAITTGGAERARIDSSGRLLVGTSTSVNTGSSGSASVQIASSLPLAVRRNENSASGPAIILGKSRGAEGTFTIVQDNDQVGEIRFAAADGTDLETLAASIRTEVDGTPGTNSMPGRIALSTTASGASFPTERMRIRADGATCLSYDFFAGGDFTKAAVQAGSVSGKMIDVTAGASQLYSSRNSTSSVNHVVFYNPNGAVGSIATSASATAYNTSSDYRLKENVTPVTDGITRLQQLKPSRFNFIADPDTTVDGFLAHEVQSIVPEAITGEKDAVDADGNPEYQGIDQSKLVPLLTAALQEAIGEIESLKARVAALEAN